MTVARWKYVWALRPVVVAGLFGVLVTLLVSVSPAVRFAYFAPPLHVAIETAGGLAALLAAYLVYGRFRHSRLWPELALVVAFAIFGGTNLVLFAVPTAVAGARPGPLLLWAGLLARLLGGAVFAAAAVAPPVRVTAPAAAGRLALAASLGMLAVITGGVALWGGGLPVGADPSAVGLGPLPFSGQPAIHVLQLVGVCLFAWAALGFGRRALRTGDDLMVWLAAGSVLGAFARVNYVLFPSLYSDWLYTGDVLRLAFYVVVLIAAAREIRRYWERIAEAEVAEERRRLARELHDGVTQELAFITRRTRIGANGLDASTVSEIAAAAERARTEARRAVAALSESGDEPFAVALSQAVEHIAARTGVKVRLDVTSARRLDREVCEHLIRIACEAVSNAVRHSGARSILVQFADEHGIRLRIADDGAGFDPDAVAAARDHGFGLLIMRERAQRLGAALRLDSRHGAGTDIEVNLS
jgi:signal transduction histidine kinase